MPPPASSRFCIVLTTGLRRVIPSPPFTFVPLRRDFGIWRLVTKIPPHGIPGRWLRFQNSSRKERSTIVPVALPSGQVDCLGSALHATAETHRRQMANSFSDCRNRTRITAPSLATGKRPNDHWPRQLRRTLSHWKLLKEPPANHRGKYQRTIHDNSLRIAKQKNISSEYKTQPFAKGWVALCEIGFY